MPVTIFGTNATDPAARGLELGRVWGPEIRRTWRGYRDFFLIHGIDMATVRAVGLAAYGAAADWAPDLAVEMRAIGAGAGLELWEVAALNARSEVLATHREPMPGECSTAVGLVPGAAPRTVQTWDWNHLMDEVKLAWRFETGSGRRMAVATEFGILGKIGVNDAGLGVHFNLLQHDADGGPAGVPVHVIARRLVEEATTLDEVEALLADVAVSASVVYTVSTWHDGAADAASFELSPVGMTRLDPVDGFLGHTNHFLAEDLATGDRLMPIEPDTVARQSELVVRRDAFSDPSLDARVAALDFHKQEGAALCCHPDPGGDPNIQWQTLLLASMDLETGELLVQDGGPCTATPEGWHRI